MPKYIEYSTVFTIEFVAFFQKVQKMLILYLQVVQAVPVVLADQAVHLDLAHTTLANPENQAHLELQEHLVLPVHLEVQVICKYS